MRKWLAGWLGQCSVWLARAADRVWPHYSERMRRAARPEGCICQYQAGVETELPWAED